MRLLRHLERGDGIRIRAGVRARECERRTIISTTADRVAAPLSKRLRFRLELGLRFRLNLG